MGKTAETQDLRYCLIDGVGHYAQWKIGGEYCFTEKDRDRVIERLGRDGINYTVKKLPEPPGFWVSKGNTYKSVRELIDHIENCKLPESMIIPTLRAQLAEQEAWIAAAITRAQEADEKADALGVRLKEIEDSQLSSKEG